MKNWDRREFLRFLGLTTIGLQMEDGIAQALDPSTKLPPHLPPQKSDSVVTARGLNYHRIIDWKDKLNEKGESFGFNNDFLAFFPLPKKVNEGLLWVNHEYASELFVSGFRKQAKASKSKQQIDLERESMGGSVVHISQDKKGQWKYHQDSPYNFRITAATPIPILSPAPIYGTHTTIGMVMNCSGGVTPWQTVLTCEEDNGQCYGERQADGTVSRGKYQWNKLYNHPPEHYGWVVEVNPFTGKVFKHTSMGRFAHESATVNVAKSGKVVVYSGDDKEGECLYKFISNTDRSLNEGTLYVADTAKGKWIALDWEKNSLLKNKYQSQLDVLIHAREAGKLVGGTRLDRAEDIAIHPKTNDVYVALSGDMKGRWGSVYGSILRISESNGDCESKSFKASTFVMGGEETELAAPDNLVFDKNGNLWLATDLSGSHMNKGKLVPFQNNSLFVIPTSGVRAGVPHRVATAPIDAEFTGITFSPDYKTLFTSVQHPGEKSKSLDSLRSNWPDGGNNIPKPAVIAFQGELIESLST